MTSSLVGSEMCIRDRPLPLCRGNGPSWGALSTEEKTKVWLNHAALVAVSYTHLTLPTICSV
eukprot:2342327-Prorocentrum_lima.AAC.1